MLARLRGGTSPRNVAACYEGLIDILVIDEADAADAPGLEAEGVRAVVTRTLMTDAAKRRALADDVLACIA
jgi:LPPG:FO 2-phospho-L-lactate transferase